MATTGTGKLNGRSEELLGRFIREYPGTDKRREDIHVATKLALYPWRVLPANFTAACRGSLRRLGMQQLSLGQLHWSAANYAPLQEAAVWRGLAACKAEGLVRQVGVSNYGARELRRIHNRLQKRGIKLASVQVQFSLISYGRLQQAVLDTANELDVLLISYSPLGLGALTGKYSEGNLPPGPRGFLFRRLLSGSATLRSCMEAIARERGKTMSQVAINWCMRKGTVPIPGAKSVAQATDNLGACGWALGDGEMLELEQLARGLKKGMIQNVFQTE